MAKFTKSGKYDDEIKELVKRIKLICLKEKIPMFMSFAVEDDGKGTVYKNEMISQELVNQKLSDDKISKLVNIMNGFECVPRMNIMEVRDDDF